MRLTSDSREWLGTFSFVRYPYFDARVMIGDARYHVTQGRDVIGEGGC